MGTVPLNECMAKNPLIVDIDKFIAEIGMPETTFGFLAANDGKFVGRIRDGGRYWPETETKVRSYMAERRAARRDAKKKVTPKHA